MINISQEEFENRVRDIISGKTTREKLQKELKMDKVTLNNKIQELSAYNPELYMEFIGKFPYKPRKYTHVNWRAMLIDIMKKGYTKSQMQEQYEISHRTIARKIYEVEDTEIANLYRKVASYRRLRRALPIELQEKVDNLPDEEIFVGGIYDKREQELMELEKKFNKELLEGKSIKEASKNCGVDNVYKRLSTLYRIEIEKNAKNQQGEPIGNSEPSDSGEER